MTSYVQRVFRSVAPLKKNSLIKANKEISVMWAQMHHSTEAMEKAQVYCKPEVESSRTSLASRTHFQVLGLGLEASSPRKLPCPRLEDSTIF